MDEAGSSGPTQKLSRISPSFDSAAIRRVYKCDLRAFVGWLRACDRTRGLGRAPFGSVRPAAGRQGPRFARSTQHEPIHLRGDLEVEMVLVRRIVVRGQDAVEDVRVGCGAHDLVQLAGL